MYNIYSITKNEIQSPSIALKLIYYVIGDKSYNVKGTPVKSKHLIALRTIKGEGKVLLKNMKLVTFDTNSFMIFRYDDVLEYYCDGELWEFWWFQFHVDSYYNFDLNKLMKVNVLENEDEQCNKCMDLIREDNVYTNQLASIYLNKLLHEWTINSSMQKSRNPHNHYTTIINSQSYIKSNISSKLSISKLAIMAGLCERQYRQVFNEIVGINPIKYIQNIRMELSEEMLKNTPLSIGEISAQLGYLNQFYFSKKFKEYHGVSPGGYRGFVP